MERYVLKKTLWRTFLQEIIMRKMKLLENNPTQDLRFSDSNTRIYLWGQKLPDTIISVLGSSGEGKSLIFEVLPGEVSVLPSSYLQAYTAVVVEITDNTENEDFVCVYQISETYCV
jgi:hypothetical protein